MRRLLLLVTALLLTGFSRCPGVFRDADRDGVLDAQDACPDAPEDYDTFQDEDGCPDVDNDGDHVLDVDDLCPLEAEDFDATADEDGCPDAGALLRLRALGRDGLPLTEGVVFLDQGEQRLTRPIGAAPVALSPGPWTLRLQAPGLRPAQRRLQVPEAGELLVEVQLHSSEVAVTQKKVGIMDAAYFEAGSDTIRRLDVPLLQAIAELLRQTPDVAQVEVAGRVSARSPAEEAQALSQRRAEAVRAFLIAEGVEAGRLVAVGYGAPAPLIDPEDSEAGVQDRVNFVVLDASTQPPADKPVARHPRVVAPPEIALDERFTVDISLTRRAYNALVNAAVAESEDAVWAGDLGLESGARAASGGLDLDLAPTAAAEGWPIDVKLQAMGFSVEALGAKRCEEDGRLNRCVFLPVDGDSDEARFALTLRRAPARGRPVIYIQLWHEGRKLAELKRAFLLEGQEAPAPVARARPATVSYNPDEPDLNITLSSVFSGQEEVPTVTVSRPLASRRALGPVEVSPRLRQGLDDFLSRWFAAFSRQGRGGTPWPDEAPELLDATLEAFGRALWTRHVPEPVKRELQRAHEAGALHAVAVDTDDPRFPWELVKPHWDTANGRVELGFLGNIARVGRWPKERSDQVRLPPTPPLELPIGALYTLSPSYTQRPLEAVAEELASLDASFGTCPLPTSAEALAQEVAALPGGVLHFAGHGDARYDTPGAPPAYGLALSEGAPLLPLHWEAMAHARPADAALLVFFNACELGQDDIAFGGYGAGWPSAVLRSGASGYIGALWPVGDAQAARFSADFYAEVDAMLERGEVPYVAEALRRVRGRLYGASKDPTYLAYVFYGDPNARFVRAEAEGCPG